MSGVGSSTISGDAVVLLDLAVGRRAGPEVGHRGGHHDHVGRVGRGLEHGRLPSRPRSRPRTTSTPAGAGRSTVVTSVTLAPRRGGLGGDGVALLARRAVGDDPHRVDRLAGAAGGDERRARPARSRGAEHRARRRRRCAPGSARRPGADVAAGQAARPRARRRARRARRSVARLSCTAGCSHISVCIAGQTTTGARVASSVAVSRSSRCRRRRRRAAGRWPGTTTTRSADWPSRVCGMGSASSHSEVCTGSEASARERGARRRSARRPRSSPGRRGRRRRPGGGRPRPPCRRRCRR